MFRPAGAKHTLQKQKRAMLPQAETALGLTHYTGFHPLPAVFSPHRAKKQQAK
jgi:hypothetical protein